MALEMLTFNKKQSPLCLNYTCCLLSYYSLHIIIHILHDPDRRRLLYRPHTLNGGYHNNFPTLLHSIIYISSCLVALLRMYVLLIEEGVICSFYNSARIHPIMIQASTASPVNVII